MTFAPCGSACTCAPFQATPCLRPHPCSLTCARPWLAQAGKPLHLFRSWTDTSHRQERTAAYAFEERRVVALPPDSRPKPAPCSLAARGPQPAKGPAAPAVPAARGTRKDPAPAGRSWLPHCRLPAVPDARLPDPSSQLPALSGPCASPHRAASACLLHPAAPAPYVARPYGAQGMEKGPSAFSREEPLNQRVCPAGQAAYPMRLPAGTTSAGRSKTTFPSFSAVRIMPQLFAPRMVRSGRLRMAQTCVPTSSSGV